MLAGVERREVARDGHPGTREHVSLDVDDSDCPRSPKARPGGEDAGRLPCARVSRFFLVPAGRRAQKRPSGCVCMAALGDFSTEQDPLAFGPENSTRARRSETEVGRQRNGADVGLTNIDGIGDVDKCGVRGFGEMGMKLVSHSHRT